MSSSSKKHGDDKSQKRTLSTEDLQDIRQDNSQSRAAADFNISHASVNPSSPLLFLRIKKAVDGDVVLGQALLDVAKHSKSSGSGRSSWVQREVKLQDAPGQSNKVKASGILYLDVLLKFDEAKLETAPAAFTTTSTSSIIYDYDSYPKSNFEEEDRKVEAGQWDHHVKLLMLGDSGVGKTSLMLRYTSGSDFVISSNFVTTIGIDYKIKLLKIRAGQTVKLQIWDTAGQERFRSIATSYFKGAHGIVLVYDVTDRVSFENIVGWAKDIKEHADATVNIILVANKIDLTSRREVSKDEGMTLARKMNVFFYEVSALTGSVVDLAFEGITHNAVDSILGKSSKKWTLDNVIEGKENSILKGTILSKQESTGGKKTSGKKESSSCSC